MQDTDYTFGTPDDPASGQDKRMQYRLTARAQVMLELEAGYPASEGVVASPLRKMVCGVRDISASGLCLLTEQELSVGALYPISVKLVNHVEPFVLMVEVSWCRPAEDGFRVGVRIIQSDQTTYVEWAEAVASAIEPP